MRRENRLGSDHYRFEGRDFLCDRCTADEQECNQERRKPPGKTVEDEHGGPLLENEAIEWIEGEEMQLRE